MFDWLPWAVSIVFLAGIAGLAAVAFRGGQGRGLHINWEQEEALHGAARARTRARVREAGYRTAYTVLALAVTGGTIAMLVAAATVDAGE